MTGPAMVKEGVGEIQKNCVKVKALQGHASYFCWQWVGGRREGRERRKRGWIKDNMVWSLLVCWIKIRKTWVQNPIFP